ncbi:MAG TPA: cytochrome c maturation protein CcmE [Herpetosiphonaceae bacterium]
MASIAVEHTSRGRTLGLKPVQWMMLGVIVLALGYGGWSLRGSLARTVTIDEARQAGGTVQVFGYLYSKGAYDEQNNWTFDIQGHDGSTLKVVHPTKPGNFEDAISVAATGHYNAEKDIFEAEQLLVKCPSKYQEQEQAGVTSAAR